MKVKLPQVTALIVAISGLIVAITPLVINFTAKRSANEALQSVRNDPRQVIKMDQKKGRYIEYKQYRVYTTNGVEKTIEDTNAKKSYSINGKELKEIK